MPRMRTKNRHLKLRGKTWWFVKDVPKFAQGAVGKPRIETSLGTRDEVTARTLRDQLLAHYEKIFAVAKARALTIETEKQTDDNNDLYWVERGVAERGLRAEGIPTSIDDVHEELTLHAVAEASENRRAGQDWHDAVDEARERIETQTIWGRELARKIDLWAGKLTYTQFGDKYLERGQQRTKNTQTDYRNTYKRADENLPPLDNVTRSDVQQWVNELGTTLSKPSINRMLSALRGLAKFHGYDPAPFRDLMVTSTRQSVKRDVWKDAEVLRLLTEAKSLRLRQAILISAFTGPRIAALPKMTFNETQRTLTFPRQKKELSARTIPCPELIHDCARQWTEDPYSISGLEKAFGKLKAQLEFGPTKVHHSFRHTVVNKLLDAGVPEVLAARVVGHAGGSVTTAVYGNKGDVEALRPAVNSIRYDGVDTTVIASLLDS
ncbi:MAG: DUF6538 domain-containing protein [Pseudomonadota bacterium]